MDTLSGALGVGKIVGAPAALLMVVVWLIGRVGNNEKRVEKMEERCDKVSEAYKTKLEEAVDDTEEDIDKKSKSLIGKFENINKERVKRFDELKLYTENQFNYVFRRIGKVETGINEIKVSVAKIATAVEFIVKNGKGGKP